MKSITRQAANLLVALTMIVVLCGCTNWKKKYVGLDVEYQNIKGRYDNCVASLDAASSEKQQLGTALAQSRTTIEDLEKQIQERQISPAEASGFGEGYDVSIDSARGTITVTLPNALLFSVGKASLKKNTIAELDHILSVLNERYGGMVIEVVGHTDSDPVKVTKKDWQDNWELSAERALSVLRYLAKQGVEPAKIRAVACGASRPVTSNATASGKARNRRVEVVVYAR